MAFPTVSAPYGLKPINRIDGMAYAGAIRQIPMASGYTATFFGDAVLIVDGYVNKDTGTTAATPCGVFVGCTYTNSQGQPVQAQYAPAGQTDMVAYVVDDPMAAFQVAVVSGTTVIASVSRDVVGSNMALVQNAGDTNTGNSGVAVLSTSTNTTNTLPIRVIDVVPATATGADAYVELIVKINTHQYNNTTGV
jgi:Tfp pilus assembly protein PilW